METNIIYNEDCLETMFGGHIDEHSIDIVLTSPPYNTSRPSSKEDPYSFRYDSYNDGLTDEEYTDFIFDILPPLKRVGFLDTSV